MDKLKDFLSLSDDPSIKSVLKFEIRVFREKLMVKNKCLLSFGLISIYFLNDQPHQLIPRKEDIFDQSKYSIISEFKILSSD